MGQDRPSIYFIFSVFSALEMLDIFTLVNKEFKE